MDEGDNAMSTDPEGDGPNYEWDEIVERILDDTRGLIAHLCSVDPPADSPLGKLLTGLAGAVEQYEREKKDGPEGPPD